MKTLHFYIFFLIPAFIYAQILPGTLNVIGMPNFTQTISDVTQEAGENDDINGFATDFDATIISFILNPTSLPTIGLTTSEQNCSANIYKYKVFVHKAYSSEYEDTVIEVKTYSNSGNRFPTDSPYDTLPILPLGPRDLYPENGGNYITIPDDPSQAIKIMEFIGCRNEIPIQFKIKPSVLSPAGSNNIEISYTIVGSIQ
mgnify:CR=1 FL=1